MKSGFWLLLMIVGVSCLVLLPNPRKTWYILSSFMHVFALEALRYSVCWLKEAKKKLTGFVKGLIYTTGRDWLDETERQITE